MIYEKSAGKITALARTGHFMGSVRLKPEWARDLIFSHCPGQSGIASHIDIIVVVRFIALGCPDDFKANHQNSHVTSF